MIKTREPDCQTFKGEDHTISEIIMFVLWSWNDQWIFVNMINYLPKSETTEPSMLSRCQICSDNEWDTDLFGFTECLTEFLYTNQLNSIVVLLLPNHKMYIKSPDNPSGKSHSHHFDLPQFIIYEAAPGFYCTSWWCDMFKSLSFASWLWESVVHVHKYQLDCPSLYI